MAIDTRAKRNSALAFRRARFRRLMPEGDGTIDQGDRQTALARYAGILAEALASLSIIPGQVYNIEIMDRPHDRWRKTKIVFPVGEN